MPLTHGHARRGRMSRAYRAWINMKSRCCNTKHPRFADWGGRGIRYAERWKSFDNFLADMGEPGSGLTLERMNNDGHYEPGNCEWRDRRSQSNNRRDTPRIPSGARALTATEWSRALGRGESTVGTRLYRGHDLATALLPHSFKGCANPVEFCGRRQSIAAWARECGMKPDRLYFRLRRGESLELALSRP